MRGIAVERPSDPEWRDIAERTTFEVVSIRVYQGGVRIDAVETPEADGRLTLC